MLNYFRTNEKNLLTDFNINVSKMTICRYIKSFNYILKTLTLQPERRNDQKSINGRETYAAKFYELIAEIDESRIYFVDEVGFNTCIHGHGSDVPALHDTMHG